MLKTLLKKLEAFSDAHPRLFFAFVLLLVVAFLVLDQDSAEEQRRRFEELWFSITDQPLPTSPDPRFPAPRFGGR